MSGVGTGRLREALHDACYWIRIPEEDETFIWKRLEDALAAAPPAAGGTIGLDGDTQRCCNAPGCDNPWPCFIHPESARPASVTLCHKMITPETSCERDSGHKGECSSTSGAPSSEAGARPDLEELIQQAFKDWFEAGRRGELDGLDKRNLMEPWIARRVKELELVARMRERASENSRHESLYIRGSGTAFGLCADWLERTLAEMPPAAPRDTELVAKILEVAQLHEDTDDGGAVFMPDDDEWGEIVGIARKLV